MFLLIQNLWVPLWTFQEPCLLMLSGSKPLKQYRILIKHYVIYSWTLMFGIKNNKISKTLLLLVKLVLLITRHLQNYKWHVCIYLLYLHKQHPNIASNFNSNIYVLPVARHLITYPVYSFGKATTIGFYSV